MKIPLSDQTSTCAGVQKVETPALSGLNPFQASIHASLSVRYGAPSPGSSKIEALADFLSPASGEKPGSPPVGLRGSIHNRDDDQLSDHKNSSQLTGSLVKKSTFHQDLEGLVAKGADKSHVFDHKVVKATEGIGRLSLD